MQITTTKCKKAFLLALAASLGVYAFLPHPTAARAEERQYKVEAAFLYSFFNYITWPGHVSPQTLQDPIICVYGSDPIIRYLDYIRLKMASERSLTVRTIKTTNDTPGCHIFFMRHRIPYGVLNGLDRSTLTVSKPDDPLDRGGMIELSADGERITININQHQLEKNNFQISSRLLELAQTAR